MSEKHLLLSSAKSGVLVKKNRGERIFLYLFACIGAVVILVGAADAVSRLSRGIDGSVLRTAFAPAVMLLNATSSDAFFGTPHATTTPLVPVTLSVPSIGVTANVEKVGKKTDGSMATPTKFEDVAWYSLGSKPGEAGNAVIAGHVNNALTKSGVFEHLASVKLGDSVSVNDGSGHVLSYKVTDIEEYPADTAPAASIFATTGPSQLVLITCDGDWVSQDKTFSNRLVVFASLQ
jgi:LPXTG-site transpeptidase (sortase) family protein